MSPLAASRIPASGYKEGVLEAMKSFTTSRPTRCRGLSLGEGAASAPWTPSLTVGPAGIRPGAAGGGAACPPGTHFSRCRRQASPGGDHECHRAGGRLGDACVVPRRRPASWPMLMPRSSSISLLHLSPRLLPVRAILSQVYPLARGMDASGGVPVAWLIGERLGTLPASAAWCCSVSVSSAWRSIGAFQRPQRLEAGHPGVRDWGHHRCLYADR